MKPGIQDPRGAEAEPGIWDPRIAETEPGMRDPWSAGTEMGIRGAAMEAQGQNGTGGPEGR